MISKEPSRCGARCCAASADTAAVRRAVTVGPSSTSARAPVATSNTTTSPWIAGRFVPALAGVKVMSLVMATRASCAGITNRLPPPGSDNTIRGGTCTVSSRNSRASSLTSAG
jgi:hypothetical protein